jgi:hypothetical protein
MKDPLQHLIELNTKRDALYYDSTTPFHKKRSQIATLTEQIRQAQDSYNRARAATAPPEDEWDVVGYRGRYFGDVRKRRQK